jgi:hypothetical protein
MRFFPALADSHPVEKVDRALRARYPSVREKPGATMLNRNDVLDTLAGALRQGRPLRVSARGVSMGPAFAGATDVLIRPVRAGEPKVGSIVVFQRGAQWVAHRVLWKINRTGGLEYITQGDGEPAADNPRVRAADCVGIVAGVGHGERLARLTAVRYRWAGMRSVARGWCRLALGWLARRVLRARKPPPARQA